MTNPNGRRAFLRTMLLGAVAAPASVASGRARTGRLLYTSAGKACLIGADGSGGKTLEFSVPNQATWQPAAAFPDGRRLLMLSMEPRRDGPGRPFEQYYHQTPTHLWTYDLTTGALDEVATKDRLAPFVTPQLLLPGGRLLVQVVRDGGGQLYSMNLDGSEQQEFTRPGDGMPYGLSLSPNGKRVAFHLAGPDGYQVWTSDVEGRSRTKLAGSAGHLYFGTSWSPDGRWVLFVDCLHEADPGHDWCDVCIGRPDGSEHRVLTSGQAMWFGATYGGPTTRGGGSNLPAWTRDGRILYPRRLPGSKVAWEYQTGRPDTDHFNRDYKPEAARGGTEVVRLDPWSGRGIALTHSEPPVWDFRCAPSPDGRQIAFCRCAVGETPALWVMNADGSHGRMLTRGLGDGGADHPRWLPTG